MVEATIAGRISSGRSGGIGPSVCGCTRIAIRAAGRTRSGRTAVHGLVALVGRLSLPIAVIRAAGVVGVRALDVSSVVGGS